MGANYHPMSNLAYIEDKNLRITMVSKSPHGVAFLKNGCIEVMLDRFLLGNDASLGMSEQIAKPTRTRHQFVLIIEKQKRPKVITNHPSGYPSLIAHTISIFLQYPVIIMRAWDSPKFQFSYPMDYGIDVLLVTLKPFVYHQTLGDKNVGVVIHRTLLDPDYGDVVRNSSIDLSVLIQPNRTAVETSVTFLDVKNKSDLVLIDLCPMDIKAYMLR